MHTTAAACHVFCCCTSPGGGIVAVSQHARTTCVRCTLQGSFGDCCLMLRGPRVYVCYTLDDPIDPARLVDDSLTAAGEAWGLWGLASGGSGQGRTQGKP